MKRLSRRAWLPVAIVLAAVSLVALSRSIHAASHSMGEGGPGTHGMTSEHPMPGHPESTADAAPTHPMMDHRGHGADSMHGMHAGGAADAMPTMPGQDAFGAIQEIVGILEADPDTDWSKVDLEALRQHLIDMNEVTLRADAAAKPIDGGLEIAVTGGDRTLVAILRMLPAHAQEIDGLHGWSAKTASLPNGVLLTVTASDAREIAHIRGLGFIGILASGHHHQPHHLAMVKGEFPHGR